MADKQRDIDAKRQKVEVPPLLDFLAACGTLQSINKYLDAMSLFEWGRVVVKVEKSLAHEIGLAILDYTMLPKHGLVPCGDLAELFDGAGYGLVEEEQPQEVIDYLNALADFKAKKKKRILRRNGLMNPDALIPLGWGERRCS